jgi:diguanylate cyclase (GGDEF)-like protein
VSSHANWWTHQLAELLSVVSSVDDATEARCCAVERAAEALESEVGALVADGRVLACLGFPAGELPDAELIALAAESPEQAELPGLGRCEIAVAPMGDGALLLGRAGDSPFSREDVHMLGGMARVLELLGRMENRRNLLEQLSAIQKAISTRAGLQEVFDTIVHAGSRLLGVEMAAIRVSDADDPSRMRTPAVIGHPDDLIDALRHGPTLAGATAPAPEHGELVVIDDYQNHVQARPEAVAHGVTTAIAAPLHEHATVIGSLVLSTTERGRKFSVADREMLAAFAEHASLALAAARTGETMRQALTDPLTGLANRVLFLDRLEHALARAARRGTGVSVLFIDLDRFKLVNDTLGHAQGDALLIEVAQRIRGCLRRAETAARLGGDEFAVLLEEARDEMGAAHVAERMAAVLKQPFLLDGREIYITASVGIAVGTVEDAGTLLRHADVAMYRAKARGKDRYEVFEPEMHAEVVDRLQLEAELRHAVHRDELELHFQPAFKLAGREVLGVEALVRWGHPQRGLLPPGMFISLAEESGLILPVGRWVLNEACRQASLWQVEHPNLQVAVNLSGWQLEQPDIVDEVSAVLERWSLSPESLVLELTETILMDDTETTIAKLRDLKELGVRLAIDDFGTGYSSLQYLQRFPIDVLKIPKPFVDELATCGGAGTLAGVILDLSRRFGLGTIAEGIETEEQAARLEELGCPWGQGFLVAKPMPVEELLEFLEQKRSAAQPEVEPLAPRRA